MLQHKADDLSHILIDLVQKYDMKKLWFSDEQNFAARGINNCFILNNLYESGVVGSISGCEQSVVEEMANSFVSLLGVHIQKKY